MGIVKGIPTMVGCTIAGWVSLRLIMGVVHPDGRPALCADLLTGLDAIDWTIRTLLLFAREAIHRALNRQEVLEWLPGRLMWMLREIRISIQTQRRSVRAAIEQGRS